jgi:hypothetical protein
MKKVSTAAARQIRKFSEHQLTIGLDLGDRSSWYCLLDEVGEVLLEQKVGTTPKAMREVFGSMPRCRIAFENGDALARGEPIAERTGTRGDRGACAQGALDRREPEEGRSAGCADAGAVGANRSAVDNRRPFLFARERAAEAGKPLRIRQPSVLEPQ